MTDRIENIDLNTIDWSKVRDPVMDYIYEQARERLESITCSYYALDRKGSALIATATMPGMVRSPRSHA